MQSESGTPHKNALVTRMDYVFFSKLFPQQLQFPTLSLLSSPLLSVGKGSEAPTAPGKALIVLGKLSMFLEEGGSAAGEESPSPGLPHHHPHRPVLSLSPLGYKAGVGISENRRSTELPV